MSQLFHDVLNMSLLGSIAILIIFVFRFGLRSFPKKYSYWLWLVAFLRLAIPMSFSFQVNWLQTNSQSPIKARFINDGVQRTVAMTQVDMVESIVDFSKKMEFAGIELFDQVSSISWMTLAANIWLLGLTCFIGYTVVQYIRLFYTMRHARKQGQIYYTAKSSDAFLFGFIRPKIVIPDQLESDQQRYVIAHEQVHLRRRDDLIKLLGYLLLMIHWFNPLVWLGYRTFEKDMEMSCDEAVIERLGKDHKVAYSNTLLSIAKTRSSLVSFPCFQKTSIRIRITNVLRYRSLKTTAAFLLIVLTLALVVGCSLNPYPATPQLPEEPIVTTPELPVKRQIQYDNVLVTPYQGYENTAAFEDKVYISIEDPAGSPKELAYLKTGIYEVNITTKQYQLLVPIQDYAGTTNLAVYQDQLFYVKDDRLYQMDLQTKAITVFRDHVSRLVSVKNGNILYYTTDLYPPKPTDPKGAGRSYLSNLMIHNFETNKTASIAEHEINYSQKYVFAYDEYLYLSSFDYENQIPILQRVNYDTLQFESITTHNKYENIIYQSGNIVVFADGGNHSVRALDENGLRVLARDVILRDQGVATKDGIYYFTEEQFKYSRLELLRYDGTTEVLSDLTDVASGFEHVYLYDDYLYYMGAEEFGVFYGRTQKAVYRYDLHDHTVMRIDDPDIGYVSSYRILGDYLVCAGNTIQVLRIRDE